MRPSGEESKKHYFLHAIRANPENFRKIAEGGRFHAGLDNPNYNLIVHTSPVDDEHKSFYLWHVQIILRLTQVAGFELGSGIYINIALPEETAAFMRAFKR